MPIRDIRGPEVIDNTVEMQYGVSYQLTNDAILIVNKATGSATAVHLPTSRRNGQVIFVKDGKGDAATNNITISDPSGSTIDGSSNFVINANYGRVCLVWDQASAPNTAEWKVLHTS